MRGEYNKRGDRGEYDGRVLSAPDERVEHDGRVLSAHDGRGEHDERVLSARSCALACGGGNGGMVRTRSAPARDKRVRGVGREPANGAVRGDIAAAPGHVADEATRALELACGGGDGGMVRVDLCRKRQRARAAAQVADAVELGHL